MLQFANTEAFYLLLLLPILVIVFVVLEHRGRKLIIKALGQRLAPFLSSSVSVGKRRLKLFFQALCIGFFALALARPQMGQGTQEVTSAGVEMLIAVDVSESMLAEDVRPNRLEFAKREIERFIERSPGHRVGLVAFAGSAALVAPMTSDFSAFKMFLDSLTPESVSTQGTNFRQALAQAKSAFERGGTVEDDTTRATQVIVIASDGEDHEEGAVELAQEIASEGIRIFSLAFGTEKGAPISLRDSRGVLKGYKKDNQGQTVLSSTKGTILRSLADAGKGAFYHATVGGNQLALLEEDIDKLEKAEFQSAQVTDYEERYQALLLIAIIFALIELLLSERRKDFRLWKGRFEVPPA